MLIILYWSQRFCWLFSSCWGCWPQLACCIQRLFVALSVFASHQSLSLSKDHFLNSFLLSSQKSLLLNFCPKNERVFQWLSPALASLSRVLLSLSTFSLFHFWINIYPYFYIGCSSFIFNFFTFEHFSSALSKVFPFTLCWALQAWNAETCSKTHNRGNLQFTVVDQRIKDWRDGNMLKIKRGACNSSTLIRQHSWYQIWLDKIWYQICTHPNGWICKKSSCRYVLKVPFWILTQYQLQCNLPNISQAQRPALTCTFYKLQQTVFVSEFVCICICAYFFCVFRCICICICF